MNNRNPEILNEKKTTKRVGMLITHGTDTMAWTLSFLKYAVNEHSFSIAITGSQIPMDESNPGSDGFENVTAALQFLTRIENPQIFAVFNMGTFAFSDSLMKIRKWHHDAFIGDKMLHREWGDIQENYQNVTISETDKKLHSLLLVTTGGTISAKKRSDGILEPSSDRVAGFINNKLGKYFESFHKLNNKPIDSSDMTLDQQISILETAFKYVQENLSHQANMSIDTKFDPSVRIIYLDPFKSIEDYEQEAKNATAVILAGYGGANLRLDMKGLLCKWVNGDSKTMPKLVIIASQVPHGVADFVYTNGYEPLKWGAISAIDLSLVECQVRASYIMGHTELLNNFLLEQGIFKSELTTKKMELVKTLFLSGVKFRNRRSAQRHFELTKVPYHKEDFLVGRPFNKNMLQSCYDYILQSASIAMKFQK